MVNSRGNLPAMGHQYKKNFAKAKDKKISLILQTGLLLRRGVPNGMTHWSGPEEGANRGTAMDARITLCSHLDHSGSETPTGPAAAAVIEAIAAAALGISA